MSAHAKLSASAAHRWLACPGSARLCATVPNPTTVHAAAGTFAHEIAAVALLGIQPPNRWLGRRRIIDDKFEIECTAEMVEAVEWYVDTIDDELVPGDVKWVEQDLTPALSKLHPDLGGTADFMRYRPDHKHLRVVDFKYGSGVLVEVEDNVQAMTYALGALLTIGKPCSTVTVAIAQPRAEHPDGMLREWTFPSALLLEFAADLVAGANAANRLNAALVPGDKQCRFCSARAICPALKDRQTVVMAEQFAEPNTLQPKEIAEALYLLPLVKARIKAIEEAAYTMAVQGTLRPEHGYKLVDKRPTRKWRDEQEVVTWAKKNAINPWAPQEVLSPAQLEKKLQEDAPKGAKKQAGKVLAPFIESVSSGQVLVPVSDDRPETTRVGAADFVATTADAPKATKAVDFF